MKKIKSIIEELEHRRTFRRIQKEEGFFTNGHRSPKCEAEDNAVRAIKLGRELE